MINEPIEKIMSDHPLTVEEDVNVGAVAHLFMRYRINGILVVKKGSKDDLAGIITTTDLLEQINGSIKKTRGSSVF